MRSEAVGILRMFRIRSFIKIIPPLMLSLLICACNRADSPAGSEDAFVFDLSNDMNYIEEAKYSLSGDDDLSGQVGELLQRMIDGPEKNRVRSAIPEQITSVTYIIGHQTINVNFDESFNDVSQMRKVLCEAAVVKTLCQLDDVYAVSFSVSSIPLCDSKNIPVGLLTPDSFIENEGAMINAYERAKLTLYFADESGQSLVEKTESITYNGNISMDRLVVDNVIAGPHSTDAFATIDPATTVISVTTQDGICYVNLSRDFLNKTSNISDEIIVYSLVNSLTELGNVNKVQILIDGSKDEKLGAYDFSSPFERNLELILPVSPEK